jgi:geranylgeranyl diphosphate synthase type I
MAAKRRSKAAPKTKARRAQRKPELRSAKTLRNNPFSALLKTVKADVDSRLKGFLDAKLDGVERHAPEVAGVIGELGALCQRGGKRLRPALVVTGFLSSSDSNDWEAALDAGVALELLHAYFLVHDDWMDQDDLRRGDLTVHAALSRRFKSSHLGAAAAILAGDYAVALATEALCRVDLPARDLPRLLMAFAEMQQAAVIGQQLDVLNAGDSVEAMYRLKTGSYTVRGPLLMGALLANAKPRVERALERFAMPAGVAFQLRDDLLSAFGNPEVTGKPYGNDIQRGKRTLLVELALEHGTREQKRALRTAYGNANADPKQLGRAIDALERSGARALVEKRIEILTTEAVSELKTSALNPKGKQLLAGAVEVLVRRDV